LLAAWCELRKGFRVFRIDRMSAFSALETRFDAEPGKTAEEFLKQDTGKKQTALQHGQPSLSPRRYRAANDGEVVPSSAVKKFLKGEGRKAVRHAAVARDWRHIKN